MPDPVPRFPVPFWDPDTVSQTRFSPNDMEHMLLPEPRTVLERRLDGFTAAIREKPRWWEKVFNAEVVEHWRAEATQQDVDDGMFNFALQVSQTLQ